jgi:two-component system LytT family response regulator
MIQSNTVLLSIAKGRDQIAPQNIFRIEALSNYSKIFFTNGKTLVVAKVLQWFENSLTATEFVRIHRSHLINIYSIEKYCSSSSVLLTDKSFLPIARRKKLIVKRILENGLAR